MTDEFSDATMQQTAQWVAWFSSAWKPDAPMHIHPDATAADGEKEWHPDFAKWLSDDEISKRTSKVMRKLRRRAVREYEVCYRILVLGDRLDATTVWLNERAERNHIPYPPQRPEGPHYTRKDALALLIAGLTYAKQYW